MVCRLNELATALCSAFMHANKDLDSWSKNRKGMSLRGSVKSCYSFFVTRINNSDECEPCLHEFFQQGCECLSIPQLLLPQKDAAMSLTNLVTILFGLCKAYPTRSVTPPHEQLMQNRENNGTWIISGHFQTTISVCLWSLVCAWKQLKIYSLRMQYVVNVHRKSMEMENP